MTAIEVKDEINNKYYQDGIELPMKWGNKLLDLIPILKDYTRIKRSSWDFFLVKSEFAERGLILCNFESLQLHEYMFTYEDLVADDWEIHE